MASWCVIDRHDGIKRTLIQNVSFKDRRIFAFRCEYIGQPHPRIHIIAHAISPLPQVTLLCAGTCFAIVSISKWFSAAAENTRESCVSRCYARAFKTDCISFSFTCLASSTRASPSRTTVCPSRPPKGSTGRIMWTRRNGQPNCIQLPGSLFWLM